MSKFQDFMSHVRAAVNKDIYLWGGGQPLKKLSELTESYIRNRETSTTNANRVIKLWKERKDKYPNAYAADCSGGIIYCMMLAGIVNSSFDTTANGLCNKSTKLGSRSELREGDWVGQKSGSNIFHIGVVDRVDANGQIWIDEWRGRDYGCVCTKIEDGASTWNVYCRPSWAYDNINDKDVEGSTDAKPETPVAPAAGWKLTRLVKETSPRMKGEDVHNIQQALMSKGYSCGSTGADGVYGPGSASAVKSFQKAQGLTADGIVGEKTCKALGGVWSPAATSNAFTLTRLLKQTSPLMKGDDVKAVQKALVNNGYSIGGTGVDGEYGKNTKSAVIHFQEDRNLSADGIVGEKTCKALGGTWKQGSSSSSTVSYAFELGRLLKDTSPNRMKGDDVKAVQNALIKAGYSVGSLGADGSFGKDSANAVKKFQKAKGLTQDGIVGEKTCKALGGKWVG